MRGAEEYLAEGFRQTVRRPHYVVADVVARLLRWSVLFFAMMMGFLATLARIPASDVDAILLRSGVGELEALVLARALSTHSGALAMNLAAALLAGAVASVAIEAVSRGVLLGLSGPASGRKAAFVGRSVLRQFASGLPRRFVFGALAIFIGLVTFGPVLAAGRGEWTWTEGEARWAAVAGLALIGLMAFSLTVLDTLARLGALELVGRSLPEVVVVTAFPALVSASIWAASLALLSAIAAREALGPGTVVAVGIATVTLTSALFFVRCASVRGIHEEIREQRKAI